MPPLPGIPLHSPSGSNPFLLCPPTASHRGLALHGSPDLLVYTAAFPLSYALLETRDLDGVPTQHLVQCYSARHGVGAQLTAAELN